jgi:hypothetical protein
MISAGFFILNQEHAYNFYRHIQTQIPMRNKNDRNLHSPPAIDELENMLHKTKSAEMKTRINMLTLLKKQLLKTRIAVAKC